MTFSIFLKKFLKSILKSLPYASVIMAVAFLSIYVFKTFDKNIKTFDSIATGIISGIITAILIFVFQVIWKKNITVWFENLLYQDVCIEGEWTGYLVPHLGIKDLDRIQRQLSFRALKDGQQIKKNKENEAKRNETVDADAVIIKENSSRSDATASDTVKAEIILHRPDKQKDNSNSNEENQKVSKKTTVETTITIKPVPITVRFEIKRTGHKICGRLIEVAGSNQINSYNIDGIFKNLILSGTYETFNRENMDRGAFSLMLIDNGKKLEGFFSVYNDGEHKIAPLQCILKKQNKVTDNSENG